MEVEDLKGAKPGSGLRGWLHVKEERDHSREMNLICDSIRCHSSSCFGTQTAPSSPVLNLRGGSHSPFRRLLRHHVPRAWPRRLCGSWLDRKERKDSVSLRFSCPC